MTLLPTTPAIDVGHLIHVALRHQSKLVKPSHSPLAQLKYDYPLLADWRCREFSAKFGADMALAHPRAQVVRRNRIVIRTPRVGFQGEGRLWQDRAGENAGRS